jgi:hypothetical protein
MDKLAAFLTSPAVAPGTPGLADNTQVALAAPPASSPEAAGIFRIVQPKVDPAPADAARRAPAAKDDTVPLPRRRPAAPIADLPAKTLTLAAARYR